MYNLNTKILSYEYFLNFVFKVLFLFLFFSISVGAYAKLLNNKNMLDGLNRLLAPKTNDDYKMVDFKSLSNFEVDKSLIDDNKQSENPEFFGLINNYTSNPIDFFDAINRVIQRDPEISQAISMLSSQNANIDVAKSQYYPQLSGGVVTGDLSSSERGRQLLNLSATQMFYDFGKVKSSVDTQRAKLSVQQANVLVSIDDIAYQTASSIINIERYRKSTQISEQQIIGIKRILDIANLRAKAGISSQADPIQAESYLQSAESNLIAQKSLLRQYQQRLTTLIGFDIANKSWIIPDDLVKLSDLYTDPEFNTIPKIIEAQAEVEVAKYQKKQTDLSRYPTFSVKGSLNQALNGENPNNNKDNGLYSSVMVEATSNFYQGGAISAQVKSASYAEQAARSRVQSVYLDILDQLRTTRENIDSKQSQMQVLAERQLTSIKTRELYQEQYKLGTRSVLDLLNAEMAIHSANNEMETARYDIYASLLQYVQVTGRTRQVYRINNVSIQGFEVQP